MSLDVWSVGEPDAPHPVLALHGFPQSARSWHAVGERLTGSGVRLVAPDQRGYSPRARPEGVEHYRMDRLVEDALVVADATGLERFHLLGHDWGAQVGWTLCERAPERVLSYTALSVPHPRAFATAYKEDEDQRRASEYIGLFWQHGVAEARLAEDDWARLRRLLEGLPDEEVEHYVARMREPGALTAALSWYRAMESGAADVRLEHRRRRAAPAGSRAVRRVRRRRLPVRRSRRRVPLDPRRGPGGGRHRGPRPRPSGLSRPVLSRPHEGPRTGRGAGPFGTGGR